MFIVNHIIQQYLRLSTKNYRKTLNSFHYILNTILSRHCGCTEKASWEEPFCADMLAQTVIGLHSPDKMPFFCRKERIRRELGLFHAISDTDEISWL